MSQVGREEFVKREIAAAGWDERTILKDDDIIDRWRLSNSRQSAMKQIKMQITGEGPSGLTLPCLRVSERVRRFRERCTTLPCG